MDWCKRQKYLTYKFVSPNNRGVPDRIVMHNGEILFVEFKAPGKHPTPLQEYEHRRIGDAGHLVLVIDSYEQGIGLIASWFAL